MRFRANARHTKHSRGIIAIINILSSQSRSTSQNFGKNSRLRGLYPAFFKRARAERLEKSVFWINVNALNIIFFSWKPSSKKCLLVHGSLQDTASPIFFLSPLQSPSLLLRNLAKCPLNSVQQLFFLSTSATLPRFIIAWCFIIGQCCRVVKTTRNEY